MEPDCSAADPREETSHTGEISPLRCLSLLHGLSEIRTDDRCAAPFHTGGR